MGSVAVQNFLKKWVSDQFSISVEKVVLNSLLTSYGCTEADLGPLSIAIDHRFGFWIDFDDSGCIQPLECLYLNDILDKIESLLGVAGGKQRQ
jgi:hypothetical protein